MKGLCVKESLVMIPHDSWGFFKGSQNCLKIVTKHFFILVGKDADGDVLGIALVQEKVAANIGQWQYFDDSNVWQNINLDTTVNDKGMIDANETELLFLTPEQKLRFKPSTLDKVWNKIEARQTILRFVLWDQSDSLPFGSHMVNIKGVYVRYVCRECRERSGLGSLEYFLRVIM